MVSHPDRPEGPGAAAASIEDTLASLGGAELPATRLAMMRLRALAADDAPDRVDAVLDRARLLGELGMDDETIAAAVLAAVAEATPL